MTVLVVGVLVIWIVTFGAMAIMPLVTERDARKRGAPLPVTLSQVGPGAAARPKRQREMAA